MPRPGPRRPLVAVRLSEEEIARVDALAAEDEVTRSEEIRRLIAVGIEARGTTNA